MQFTVQRNDLLGALQAVIGVVERRQTMPILSNVLVEIRDNNELVVTGTDLELELIARCPVQTGVSGSAAIPARKLLDICRGLDRDAELSVELAGNVVRLLSGKARFSLTTLSAGDWPHLDEIQGQRVIRVTQQTLRGLLDRTHFAMAHQDVRYYLNGLLLVMTPDIIRCVATDGHRLALSESTQATGLDETTQAIVPRKAVTELIRVLGHDETEVNVQISSRHLRVELAEITLTTKLIDGRFPDYERVIPQSAPYRLQAPRETIRQALSRIAILSNENFGGVRLQLSDNTLRLQAQNVDREEAEDEITVAYGDEEMEIGFNINYLMDALGAMTTDEFTLDLAGADSSGLIQAVADDATRYVVMPMRL